MSGDAAPAAAEAAQSRPLRILKPLLAVWLTVASLAWAADLYRPVGLLLYTEQFLAGMLGIALALVFVQFPARRGGARAAIPWYDAIAAVAALGAGAYVAVDYPVMVDEMIDKPADALVCSLILFALCIEGLRRAVGYTLVIVLVVFVGYALIGHMGPGLLRTRQIDFDKLFIYLVLDNSALLGIPLKIGTTIVIAFVFFGQLLLRSRGSNFFNDFAIALMGRYRGGSAKIAITASSMFGSISGIAASNIMATGVVTIPMMKRAGYPGHVAAAIEAVASTGGQLVPPVMGAVAFLMAEILAISYQEVVIAALVPAILYYVALFILADLEAARGAYTRVPRDMIPRLLPVIARGWIFVAPFAVLIVGLFSFNLLPEKAAIYASAALFLVAVVFGYGGHRLTLKDLWHAAVETGLSVIAVLTIVPAAGFIMGVLNLSGLGFALTIALVEAGAGSVLVLLVLAAAVCIVLGMGMPSVGVYVLLAVLVAPSLVEVGVPPLAAHMFIFYFGMMSLITPPVAVAAFFAANLAGAPPMRTGFAAMRLGWTAYIVPFLFVFSPSLLLEGDPARVVLAVATAVGGVWLVSVGVIGFFTRRLEVAMRALFVLSGLMLMLPMGAVSWGVWSDVAGFLLGVLLVAYEVIQVRQPRSAQDAAE